MELNSKIRKRDFEFGNVATMLRCFLCGKRQWLSDTAGLREEGPHLDFLQSIEKASGRLLQGRASGGRVNHGVKDLCKVGKMRSGEKTLQHYFADEDEMGM